MPHIGGDEEKMLAEVEADARAKALPILDHDEAAVLRLLVRIARPTLIVELGTAIGYSGIWMLRGWPSTRLVTFEVDRERAARARENFARAGLGDRADVR